MKWIEEAKAWLNGKQVQRYNTVEGLWETINKPETFTAMPSFNDGLEYRIKPEVLYARLYLTTEKIVDRAVVSEAEKYKIEDEDGIHLIEVCKFKCWLGPIVEFEWE